MLLSASVERFGVSRTRFFFVQVWFASVFAQSPVSSALPLKKFISFSEFELTLSPNSFNFEKELIFFFILEERVNKNSERELNFLEFGEKGNTNLKKFSTFSEF